MSFIPCYNWKTSILKRVNRYSFFQPSLLLFFNRHISCFINSILVLKSFRILYVISTITERYLFQSFKIKISNVIAINCYLILYLVSILSALRFFLIDFIIRLFLLHSFCNFFTFFLVNKRSTKPLWKHVSRSATLAQLGFAVNSLFSMTFRPENIAEQRGIVGFWVGERNLPN